MAILSYGWAFTQTSFGGYLGYVIPLVMCLVCFLAGVCAATASAVSALPKAPPVHQRRSQGLTRASVVTGIQATTTLALFALIGVMLAW